MPVSFGTITIATGVIVLLGWIPLRQRPGLGTVSNVLVIGIVVDIALRLLATPTHLPASSSSTFTAMQSARISTPCSSASGTCVTSGEAFAFTLHPCRQRPR